MSYGRIKIENSPTGKCICNRCEQPLIKGKLRVVEVKGSGKWQKTERFCTDCGEHRLFEIGQEISEQIMMLKGAM